MNPQQKYSKQNSRVDAVQSDDDDDPIIEDPPEKRVVSNFLQNLPGVTASDSMAYRIEALRVYLENQIGDELFLAAYKHLNVTFIGLKISRIWEWRMTRNMTHSRIFWARKR